MDQNLDHGDFVYICIKQNEWLVLNGRMSHGLMFGPYIMY